MAPMLRKTMGFALTGLLMMAPISMAAGTAGGTAGSPSSPSTGSTAGQPGMQMQQPGTATMGQHSGNRFHATVEDIDQNDSTIELRFDGSSDNIELKVPNKEMLGGLKKGDRVQVSIEKASGQSR